MKNKSIPFITAILLVALLVGCINNQGTPNAPMQAQAQTTSQESQRTISVSGMGEVQAQPDMATVNLGVQTEAETAQAALDENKSQVQALMDALIGAGIPEEDIETQRFQLTPRYNYDNATDTQTLIGYSVSNIVQVKTSDLNTLGELLDLAVNAGANTIQNIRFDVSNPQEIASQARQSAVEDARSKAEQLASLTGSTLGAVMSIQETGNSPVPVEQPAVASAEAAAVPVRPSSYQLTINVNITWSLVDTP